ncbi:MAG: HD-GYP domain-containing protein [Thermoanaerobaculia bacterium]
MQRERTPVEQLIVEFSAAVNSRGLYGENHPSLKSSVIRVVNRLEQNLGAAGREELTFYVVGDELIVDQQPLRNDTLFQRHFVQMLRRRHVERLTVVRGITEEELSRFVTAMSSGTPPESSDHLTVGRVEIGFTDEDAEKNKGGGSDGLTPEKLERAKEAFTRFRQDRKVGLSQLEEVISGLVESLARSTRSMLPLATLKGHDEYTFVHSVNVSLLVMSLARWHGFPNEQVQSMGMAAMLHDIGKLTIPIDILNKPGRLDGEEWTMMASHAEQGAWDLARSSSTPSLAIAVAFEHHLRFDGEANYPILRTPRRPILVSRMTAIADTFDAICTMRPYQKAQSAAAALEIIRKRAGTFYDPFLVANFDLMVRESGAGGFAEPSG